jgi:hypothetical protein
MYRYRDSSTPKADIFVAKKGCKEMEAAGV